MASSESSDPRRGSNTFKGTPPIPALITRLGKGPGTSAPKGADLQGPSQVDQGLELEAEFPHEMGSEMQSNAARKARRTVIGRTLEGRPTFKALHKCLKLHLPATFTSITLLTRGYFLISFENEEGAIATRKLTTVDWSGLSLSFSRFSPDFDSSAQGAEALLTHTIKVQFPDIHEEFRNVKALTIMASALGTVLEIEAAESYIKRPAGPMVTVEVQDISRLAGYIRIPSMAEGAPITNTVRQRILYSGLPNQCRKCRQFGHHARACNVTITRPWEGPPHHIPTRGENKGGGTEPSEAVHGAAQARGPKPHANAPSAPHSKRGGKPRAGSPRCKAPLPLPGTIPTSPTRPPPFRKLGTGRQSEEADGQRNKGPELSWIYFCFTWVSFHPKCEISLKLNLFSIQSINIVKGTTCVKSFVFLVRVLDFDWKWVMNQRWQTWKFDPCNFYFMKA